MDVHPIIRQVVNRCHVADSHRKVARYVMSRLQDGPAAYWSMPREDRHGFLRMVFHVDVENQGLYAKVVTGRF